MQRRWSVTGYALASVRPGVIIDGAGDTADTAADVAALGAVGVIAHLPGTVRAQLGANAAASLTTLSDGAIAADAALRVGLAQHWDLELVGRATRGDTAVTIGIAAFR